GEQPVGSFVVLAERDCLAGMVVVAGGLTQQGDLVQAHLHTWQVQGRVLGCFTDQTLSVGVVAELRVGAVFHHPTQVAFGVPFQFLVVVGGEAAGHVARLVVAVLFQLGAGGAGLLDLGESVRLGLSGCGVGVGADGVAAGGVLGFTQTVAHRVVGIGV